MQGNKSPMGTCAAERKNGLDWIPANHSPTECIEPSDFRRIHGSALGTEIYRWLDRIHAYGFALKVALDSKLGGLTQKSQ
jgi:hypothetical protein